MIRANELVPGADVVFVTLDTLRFDVAQDAWRAGETPELARLLPETGWEERHAPGNFTWSSHQAMFAGFLPTPARPGPHARHFACAFAGSETTGPHTVVVDAPEIVTGLRQLGYRTVCIGGVGFFNRQTPLGRVMPDYFEESHWAPDLGVTDPDSAHNQAQLAVDVVGGTAHDRPLFLFVNVAALHQPNWFYLPEAVQAGTGRTDSLLSHRYALRHVDGALAPLWAALRDRAARRGTSCLSIVCSDHGTAYGEDGHRGHRVGLPCVWTVPYAEFVLGVR